jgi:hypothetical protein
MGERQDANKHPRNLEVEALREGVRAWVDVLKHFSTLSGATAVGVAALQETLELGNVGTVLSLVALGLSFVVALLGIWLVSTALGGPDRDVGVSRRVEIGSWTSAISGILLMSGVVTFMISSLVSGL